MIGVKAASFWGFFTPRDVFKQGGSDREDEPACGHITEICVRVCMCVSEREADKREKINCPCWTKGD